MSKKTHPDTRIPNDEPTANDIRKITGAATPHFSQQIRQRVIGLIDGLPNRHPARVEGERQATRLEELAEKSDGRPHLDG